MVCLPAAEKTRNVRKATTVTRRTRNDKLDRLPLGIVHMVLLSP
jgi:hypothetical protein